MSADLVALKRLFLLANITIIDRCNRLYRDITEAIECLKSWRKIQNIGGNGSKLEVVTLD